MVGIEALLDRACGHAQCLATRSHLDGFEVETVGRSRRDQRFDFGDDLGFEGRFEPPFWATSFEATSGSLSLASHSCSLASTSSLLNLRKRLYSAIWSRVRSTACAGITVVTVLPFTSRVSDQLDRGRPRLRPRSDSWACHNGGSARRASRAAGHPAPRGQF
jgi:hypothetical protein